MCTLKNRLSDIEFIQTGPFGSQLHSYDYVDDGVPVVMPQDINFGRITLEKIARISNQKANSLSRHLICHNDVIFSRRGDLTRSAYVSRLLNNVGLFCGTGCLLLHPEEKNIHGGWFSYLYQSRLIQSQVDGLAVGTTMPNMNSSILGKLVVAFPNRDEQKAIYERSYVIECKLDVFHKEIEKYQKQKKGLMQDLLTGKVQVNA